jgi:alkylation response protein AidB-like acyl-CoA dehydrogenase
MDLAYGPDYEAFRKQVRDFIAKHHDRSPRLEWQRLLIENGYAARTIPKEYGGYGAQPDILKSRIIAEEFSRAGAPMGRLGSRLAPNQSH